MEETPSLQSEIEETKEQDLAVYRQREEEHHIARQKQHAADFLLKQKFAPIQAFRADCERSMVEAQKPKFLKRLKTHREKKSEQARKAHERAEEEALMAMQRHAQQETDAAREREAREEARRLEAEATQAQHEADVAREEDN